MTDSKCLLSYACTDFDNEAYRLLMQVMSILTRAVNLENLGSSNFENHKFPPSLETIDES